MSINQDRPGSAPRAERITARLGYPPHRQVAFPSGNSLGRDPGQTSPLEPFLAVLNVVDRGRREEVLRRLSASHDTPDVAQFTRELVRDGLITAYQAAAILQGKWQELFVGPYSVRDKIGSGGMGMVFKAIHRDHGAVVALKIMPPSFAHQDQAAVRRFHCEAQALARLQHPNIVSCYEEVQETEGLYYLVMEYVDGRDLSFLVRNHGLFPVEQAIDCLLQAARGLQVAHALGIFHRDIKPTNLMLDRKDTIRILDFGLAAVTLGDSWGGDDGDPSATGAIMGTIPYMSPEQASDSSRVDARSDIYSLGCTLHFLLTGRSPYPGRTWSEMFLAHRKAPIPSLKAARPTVPDHLERLFVRMLAKDPADRPPSMASVIASLERDRGRGTPEARVLADHPGPRARRVGRARSRPDVQPRRPQDRVARQASPQQILLHWPASQTPGRAVGRQTTTRVSSRGGLHHARNYPHR